LTVLRPAHFCCFVVGLVIVSGQIDHLQLTSITPPHQQSGLHYHIDKWDKNGAEKTGRSQAKPKKSPPKKPAAKTVKKQQKPSFIVGLGASAGGLEAFEEFFKHLPKLSGMAFVLISHLDPRHETLLPELIQKSSEMVVTQASDGTKILPNHVYTIPPKHDLAVLDGVLQLLDSPRFPNPRLPIDFFFRSLAQDQRENAIGIILSGMGTDGTHGLRAIKGELGMAMVQDPDTATYNGMPNSAIDTGIIDFILPPKKMASTLKEYADRMFDKNKIDNLTPTDRKFSDSLQKVFILLRSHTGHDFSSYKQNTIIRRVERRLVVNQLDNIGQYIHLLQTNKAEIDLLFKELLIGVTSFFRDPAAFDILQSEILQPMLKEMPADYTFRVWVPGCSTGEEAYSIAILLRECTEKLDAHINIQVFATDIDESAIDVARGGLYPASISADVGAKRLQRFFSLADSTYSIKKDIREHLVFAPQDIIKDPPFTKIDLICCRNLMIYLDSKLQHHLLQMFHYALKPQGILFLGSSESTGAASRLYSVADKKWKIYQRRESKVKIPVPLRYSPNPQLKENLPSRGTTQSKEFDIGTETHSSLLNRFAPPTVITDTQGDILFIHGRTGNYLEPAPGNAKMNILEMARDGLKMEIAAAIRQVATEGNEVISKNLEVLNGGRTERLDLIVRPLKKTEIGTNMLMIAFISGLTGGEQADLLPDKPTSKRESKKLSLLQKELQHTRENLQTTIEELETTNEELKSANEELQSTNEELQSTNEELETSKEEQQSMNEELTTVNNELQNKISDFTVANNDMKNLLDSIEIPTIFLDNDLCVARFTSHAKKVINLIPTDVGRPIRDIATRVTNIDLVAEAKQVLDTLVFSETEVMSEEGTFYNVRIAPYRTIENVIEGVVITFIKLAKIEETDLTLVKLATLLNDSNDAITLQDLDGKILTWNKGAERMYGYSAEQALTMTIYDLVPAGKKKETEKYMKQLAAGKKIESYKTQRLTSQGQKLDIWMTITSVLKHNSEPLIATTERDLAGLKE
jgi:two-component system, chemotaxis family, CheB/CheR fusion protein